MKSSACNLLISSLLLSLLCGLTSCSLTKGLATDEEIYLGTDIRFADREQAASVEEFDFNINKIPRPSTTSGLFNIYTGLYNLSPSPPEKGFRHWVKHQLGKKPILYSGEMLGNTEARLQYYLNGKGFFGHGVKCDSVAHQRTVRLTCDVQLGQRYIVDSIAFPADSTYAALKLDGKLQRAIIAEGNYYDRERLEYERIRLATLAQSIGFAEFGVEHIYFYVDTLGKDHAVDIYAEVVQPRDSTPHTRYTLDSIRIFPNYSLDNQAADRSLDTAYVRNGLTIIESNHYLNHPLLDRLILQAPGQYYDGNAEKRTINRLLDLGVFRFINVRNRTVDNGAVGSIVQDILLTPEQMQRVSGEVELNNRSGNFFGTGVSIRYHHKNLFRHAERLDVTVGGQVETQLDEASSFINSSDVTASASLAFPRWIVPFIDIREARNFIPRSVVTTTFTSQRRVQYYSLQSITGKFGYRWRETSKKLHELYPIVINDVRTRNQTDAFTDLLQSDPRLLASFENTLINGLQYYFTYQDQTSRSDRNHLYFRGELETSGNLLQAVLPSDDDGIGRIAGLRFAQFTKVTLDLRRYWSLGSTTIATRAIAGAGLSYGNSSELPYIKQYLIGGSNSLRAFQLRGLGPGNFVRSSNTTFNQQFVDQTGDLKLELNVEYRFPVLNFIKGALFVDAGNIWLIDNDEIPEGQFSLDSFLLQIAIGTGLGIRLDFDFFLLRMDLAFPLRRPESGGFEWVFRDVDPGSASWRTDNLRYNLGIGYPF